MIKTDTICCLIAPLVILSGRYDKSDQIITFEPMVKFPAKILSFLLLGPVYFYRWFISPLLPPSCRHVPTCSLYALDAVKKHGPLKGFVLATNRILRCRPGGTHGYDPVPDFIFRRYRVAFWSLKRYPSCSRLKERD